jgi:hypothetical protein
MLEFISSNWAALLIAGLAFTKVIVNLTPSEKDNKIFAYIDDLINYFVTDRRI